ncbi:MAG: phospholipid-binding protein MlaC [Gammaproteobacteria bacterium]
MKIVQVISSFIMAACLTMSTTVLAADASAATAGDPQAAATTLLRGVSDQLIARLTKDKVAIKKDTHVIIEIVDTIIMPVTDFELIAKRVLGHNWRTASVTQQQEFLKEFKLLLIVTYIAAFRSYEDQSVAFKGERADPQDPTRVEVKTLIQEPGAPPIPVNYRLHIVDGKWLVYDFNVDGVGLTSSFRSQFDEAVRQKGMDGMLADMRKKNDEVFGKHNANNQASN